LQILLSFVTVGADTDVEDVSDIEKEEIRNKPVKEAKRALEIADENIKKYKDMKRRRAILARPVSSVRQTIEELSD
jgi:hypothetical protein